MFTDLFDQIKSGPHLFVCLWVTLDLHDCYCLPKNQSITNFQEYILQIWGPQMRLWGVKRESVRHHSRPGVSVGQLGQNLNLGFQGLWLKIDSVSPPIYILCKMYPVVKRWIQCQKYWTFLTNFVHEICHIFANLFEVRKHISKALKSKIMSSETGHTIDNVDILSSINNVHFFS